jgi:hypothetical protein
MSMHTATPKTITYIPHPSSTSSNESTALITIIDLVCTVAVGGFIYYRISKVLTPKPRTPEPKPSQFITSLTKACIAGIVGGGIVLLSYSSLRNAYIKSPNIREIK